MKVRLVAFTQPAAPEFFPELPPESVSQEMMTPDQLIAYVARVSNPSNQDNHETASKLLAYCIRKGHWSIFETAGMTVEIETSRAVETQLLRHRSFTFQSFSQRYAHVPFAWESSNARRQDDKNRQNSIDDLPDDVQHWWHAAQEAAYRGAYNLYEEALKRGVAKECARFLLPAATRTRLYMTGSCRSWLTYFMQRCAPETQLEHRQVAEAVREIFTKVFPSVAAALEEA